MLAGLIFLPLVSFGQPRVGIVAPGDILEEIRAAQNAPSTSEIKCELVAEAQFEELGHAWMEVVHPDYEHKFMEEMVAGPSPEAYRLMHVRMGARYLGCDYRKWDFEAARGGETTRTAASDTSRLFIWLIAGVAVVAVLARAVRKA